MHDEQSVREQWTQITVTRANIGATLGSKHNESRMAERQDASMNDPAQASSTTPLPQTGDEYLESLDDGREVWIYGEKVKNVTTHPAFRNSARSIARLYDALHEEKHAKTLLRPTDTGNGGMTHPFFKVATSKQDLRDSAEAIKLWQEINAGWIGRSPDYKAAMLTTLGAHPEWFGEYEQNARNWYKASQENVLHMAHAIANPPVDRGGAIEDSGDVFVHVEKETDNGIIVSGAKVVATGAPLTQQTFVSHFLAPVKDKRFAVQFIAPGNGKGIKYLARASYEEVAARAAAPFDYPLSSRLDENDAILIFDSALIPWENVTIYDVDRVMSFPHVSGWMHRGKLQSAQRLATKFEFLAAVTFQALQITGAGQFRGVQAALGEIISSVHIINAIKDGMIEAAEPDFGPVSIGPNAHYANAYAALAPTLYRKARALIEEVIASGLIYLNSNAIDFETPEIRPLLDRYLRGSNGKTAVDRSRTMKLLWDAIGSEFGARHELYELNYFGQPEAHHLAALRTSQTTGLMDRWEEMVNRITSDYDLTGWTAPDLINAGTESFLQGRK